MNLNNFEFKKSTLFSEFVSDFSSKEEFENEKNVFEDSVSLENARIMKLKKTFDTMNLTDRFWQAHAIDEITKIRGSIEAIQQSMNYSKILTDNLKDANSQMYIKKLIATHEVNKIQYTSSVDEFEKKFKKTQKFLANKTYQRENIEKSCQHLEII